MTRVLVVGATLDSEQTLLSRLQDMAGLPQGTLSACRDPGQCDVLIVRDSPGLRSAALRMRQGRPEMQLWVEDSQGMLRDGGDLQLPLLCRDDIVSVLAGEGQEQQGSAQVIPMPLSAQALARMQSVRMQQAAEQSARQEIREDHAMTDHGQPADKGGDLPSAAAVSAPAVQTLWQGHAVQVQGATEVTRRLRKGIREQTGHCLLQVRGHLLAVMDFAHGQAIVPNDEGATGLVETSQWLGSHLSDALLEEISADQFQVFEGRGQRMPLRALLWQSAQGYGEWGQLDAKLAAGALIHLQGWPDFRVLARQQDVFRLCSLLVKRPCTLHECMGLLDLHREVVESFVHSAFLSGYARLEGVSDGQGAASSMHVPGQSGETVEQPVSKVGGLLARMWRSVRGAARGC